MSEQEKKIPILEKRSDRRTFIKNSGLTVGGLVLGGTIGSLLGGKKEAVTQTAVHETSQGMVDYNETFQFFTRQVDFDALSSATEVIFPEDKNGPGAIALGVPYFIDRQLAGPFGSNSEEFRKMPFQAGEIALTNGDIFLQGVRKLNEVSKKEHDDTLFKDLAEEQQIAILEAFEKGEIEMNLISSAQFFAILRQSILEGCYSDPMYGGNKNMAGWKMKEYPGAQMSYANMVEDAEFKVIDPISVKMHQS